MYPQPQAEQPQQPKKKKKASPALVAVVLALIVGLCVIGGVLIGGGEDKPRNPVTDDESIGAEVMCEQFIEKRLKAPATATYADPKTIKNAGTYTVRGAVDSENSFGAKIRTQYTCVVTDNGDDTWKLEDLNLAE